jgi:hypothetical protein
MIRNFIIAAIFAAATFSFGGIYTAEAAPKCNPGIQSCKTQVKALVDQKMKARCDRFGAIQETNERRCRGLDVRRGGPGKTLEDCAECCADLRTDRENWRLCASLGLAPRVPEAKLAESEAKLCGD